jgi:hypothetical protein
MEVRVPHRFIVVISVALSLLLAQLACPRSRYVTVDTQYKLSTDGTHQAATLAFAKNSTECSLIFSDPAMMEYLASFGSKSVPVIFQVQSDQGKPRLADVFKVGDRKVGGFNAEPPKVAVRYTFNLREPGKSMTANPSGQASLDTLPQ